MLFIRDISTHLPNYMILKIAELINRLWMSIALFFP